MAFIVAYIAKIKVFLILIQNLNLKFYSKKIKMHKNLYVLNKIQITENKILRMCTYSDLMEKNG